MESLDIARDCGADGVFLINQGMKTPQVLTLSRLIRRTHPGLWVGLNILGQSPWGTLAQGDLECAKGLWCDNAGVDAMTLAEFESHRRNWTTLKVHHPWDGLYFGGTAFKTQDPVPLQHLPTVAKRAASFVDVVTTSGPDTGVPAEIEKVRVIREAIGNHPMALASGVDCENVSLYLPYVDAFLVASGIEEAFGVLDPQKTRRLADLIHGA